MTIAAMLYKLILGPLVLLFDVIYAKAYQVLGNPGLSIIGLSLAMNLLVLPLYRRADAMQEEERRSSLALQPGVDHIKKTFSGSERYMMLQTYYRQNDYKPWFALKGSLSLLLEIPFFIAAYRFLSGLQLLQGVAFGPIRDLGAPDGLITVAGRAVHLLPLLMTSINIVSGAIYTRGMPLKSKLQLYGMALVFLVLLYPSPSGLVFYWTLNNLFSLAKNVFYRLRNPKKVLASLCAALGLVLLVFLLFVHPMDSLRRQLIMIVLALALLAPLALVVLHGKRPARPVQPVGKGETALFWLGCAVLTLLTGVLIPSSVIHASPVEFVNLDHPQSPVRLLLGSALTASGAFLLWGGIFYRLSGPRARQGFCYGALIAAGVGVMDFMLFGKNYGNMSFALQYDNPFVNSIPQYLLNTIAAAAVAAALYLLWRFRPALLRAVAVAAVVALAGTVLVNVYGIQADMADIRDNLDAPDEDTASIPLSRQGKNVMFIMLDRGINRFFPYLIEEKPELKRQFDGFTYYPNTLSFGGCTMIGAPALFGGYEYTPENINRRDDTLLMDKNNEALKVMPVNFLNAGYEVTVCDPPNAGYFITPDLSIYDDYPDIRRYNTNGAFNVDKEALAERRDDIWDRNLFCYGIFRAAPLVFHGTLYNNGLYNESNMADSLGNMIQTIEDKSRARGIFHNFMNAYTVLESLPVISSIRDAGQNTFMMINNETAHDHMLLQEPEYIPAEVVDNTEYDAAHKYRYAADGSKLYLKNARQMSHYQSNMAAILKLGEWFDWMRQNGVYDNTRIIIASDHGINLNLFHHPPSDRSYMEVTRYHPLLLVKDFDRHGLETDDAFMTQADAPVIAFAGLIDDPVNPATGNPITDAPKRTPVKHVAYTPTVNVERKRRDTVYTDLIWLETQNSMNPDAWRELGPGTLPPQG